MKAIAKGWVICYNIKAVSEEIRWDIAKRLRQRTLTPSPMVRIHLSQPFLKSYFGVSPSGKATDSDSVIPKVRILLPQPEGVFAEV